MQAKITDTAHDTDAAAGYVDKMDEQYMTQQQRAERYADQDYWSGKRCCFNIMLPKKQQKNVETTSGSVKVFVKALYTNGSKDPSLRMVKVDG